MRVLVVEDIKAWAISLKTLLHKENYEVELAYTGSQALKLLENQSFELVILDLKLPDMHGVNILRKIRKNYTSAALPVIILSVFEEEQTAVLQEDANDFIEKPFNETKLLLKVRNLLNLQHTHMQLQESNRLQQNQNLRLRALDECRDAIMHATDEQQLADTIAGIVSDTLKFRLVWTGLKVEDEARSIEIIASRGARQDYINKLHVSWADDMYGNGPAGSSIKTGEPVNMDVEAPQFAPWREVAKQQGFKRVCFIPLVTSDAVLGTMGFYSQRKKIPEDEVLYLRELVEKVASGIQNLRNALVLERERKALRESEEKFKSLFAASPDAIILANARTGIIVDANFAATELLKPIKSPSLPLNYSAWSGFSQKSSLKASVASLKENPILPI